MKHILVIILLLSMFISCQVTASDSCPDNVIQTLQYRTQALHARKSSISKGTPLWTAEGGDNCSCIRSIPDVNGDGIADVITGYDINQNGDNFICFSGASMGTATPLWSIETTGGLSGGYFWGDDCITSGSDADGNGYPNILAGLAGGGRFAASYDGLDGSLIWQFNTYNEPDSGWIYSIRELGDVTGDGISEVIFGCGSDNDHAYCIDGASTGTSPTVLWSLSLPDASFAVSPISDVNNDGWPDALISSGDSYGHNVYCVEGDSVGSGNILWNYDAIDSVHTMTTISDVNGNGSEDFIVGTWGSGVRCADGLTASDLWSNSLGNTYIMMVRRLPDVTGDGIDECLVGSWENKIVCLNGSDGSTLWTTPTGSLNGGDVWTISASPDIDGDGICDVIAGSFDTYVYCVSGVNGDHLFSYQTNNRVFSVSPGSDLNSDGIQDLLAGTQDTNNYTVVFAVSGEDELSTPTPEICINDGDVNLDSEITSSDAQICFLIALGSISPGFEEECAADCNGDELVTAGDAQQIFMTALGSETCSDPLS